MATTKKTGNRIRYSGVYRLYRNGVLVKETPYSLLDAFGDTPAITVEELELMQTHEIEARAKAMIEAIADKCTEFNVINNVIYESDECSEEEDFMIGQIIDFAGNTAKIDTEKWKICNGELLRQEDYPELFDVIGTLYNNASTPAGMFNLPACGKRVTVGYSETDVSYTLGKTGGSEKVTLAANQLPNFTMSLPGQKGGDNDDMSNTTAFAGGDKNPAETSFNFNLDVKYSRDKSTAEYAQPHDNMQPYIVFIKLIRYK
jgi:microcystin-dependent protein